MALRDQGKQNKIVPIPPQVKAKATTQPLIPLSDHDDPEFKIVYDWLWNAKSIDVPDSKKIADSFNALTQRRSQDVILKIVKGLADADNRNDIVCALMFSLRTAILARERADYKRVAIEKSYMGKRIHGGVLTEDDQQKLISLVRSLHEIAELLVERSVAMVYWLLNCDAICVDELSVKRLELIQALSAVRAQSANEEHWNYLRTSLRSLEDAVRYQKIKAPSKPIPPVASDKKSELKVVDMALAVLAAHPDWSTKRIAEYLECDRSYIQKAEKFKKARAAQKSHRHDMRKGYRDSRSGNLDVIDPRADEEDDEQD